MVARLRDDYHDWATRHAGVSFVEIPARVGMVRTEVTFFDHARMGRWVQESTLDALVAMLDSYATVAGSSFNRRRDSAMDLFAPRREAAGKALLGERRQGGSVVDLEDNYWCVAPRQRTGRAASLGARGLSSSILTVEDDRTVLDRLRVRGLPAITTVYLSAVTGPTKNGKDHVWPSRHSTGLAVDISRLNGASVSDICRAVRGGGASSEHPLRDAVLALQLLFKGHECFGPFVSRCDGAPRFVSGHLDHLHFSVSGVHTDKLASGLLGVYEWDGSRNSPSNSALA